MKVFFDGWFRRHEAMCGIAGFFTPGGIERQAATRTIARMAEAIRHRGPDGHGEWVDAESGVALGHARLAVIDLSPNGAQPMISPAGRYVLTFNGEIYNHLELRTALEQSDSTLRFRSHSDTESLLAGFDRWGVVPTLARAVGMFAFALWDRQTCRLTLARDRFGEKPLYYGWQRACGVSSLLFASELKSLHQHPAFEKALDRTSAARFFERLCVPGLDSIFAGVVKVAPGTCVTFEAGAREGRVEAYWSLSDALARGAEARAKGSEGELIEQTEAMLSRAVKRQMQSDAPLGAFLSGGVDSSAIVALMRHHSNAPVKTFTIGFSEAEFDESDHAAQVARHLATEHTTLLVTPRESQAVIPRLCEIYDEPFADVSQIPTFILARLTRQQVTVSLSGDAGDELFAGYTRYGNALKAWRLCGLLPRAAWMLLSPLGRATERLAAARAPMVRLERAARVLGMMDTRCIGEYFAASTNFARIAQPMLQGVGDHNLEAGAAATDIERLCEIDVRGYLVDDILVKIDRAAMASSLETRVPLLDHEMAEFAFSLPPDMKRPCQASTASKWALRQVLYRHVPKELIERPKKGFGVPIGEWLRGSLREWANDYLAAPALGRDGMLDATLIRRLWSDHLSRRADNSPLLWAALMFCTWRERWL